MAYKVITVLWLALLPAWLLVGCCRTYVRRLPRFDCLVVSLTVLAGLLLGTRIFGPSFHGVEYEDAFEYLYAGLLMALDVPARQVSLNPICIHGSLESCTAIATLAHPIGLATLVSWMARAVGPSNWYVHYISAISFTCSGVASYAIARSVGAPRPVAVWAPALLFVTPSFHALRVTSLSEPLSGALVSGVVLLVLVFREGKEPPRTRILISLAIAITVALAITVRRDNLLLCLVIPVAMSFVEVPGSRGRLFLRAAVPCLVGSLIVLVAPSIVELTIVSNSSQAPFRVENFLDLLPHFLLHLLSVYRYGVLPWLVIVGLVFSRRVRVMLPIIVLVTGYGALFLLFGQSYSYEVLHEIPFFHFERYIIQIAPLLSVFGAIGIGAVAEGCCLRWPSVAGRGRYIVVGLLLVVAIPSMMAGMTIRRAYAAEEDQTRIGPTAHACSTLPQNAIVITSQPILVGLFCGSGQRAISFATLGARVANRRLMDDTALYVLEDGSTASTERARYPAAAQVIDSFTRSIYEEFRSGGRTYRIYRLNWD